MRRMLIAGNWKMNGLQAARREAEAIKAHVAAYAPGADVLICPPATLLADLSRDLEGVAATGGQDCHSAEGGAHTGDASAEMLADAGARYVIVGHSERRADHGETDEVVRAKARAAHRGHLTAIICVGETEAQRDADDAEAVVSAQLRGSIPDEATSANTVLAYEPVWAIGTGRTPTTEDVEAMHGAIRGALAERFGSEAAAATRILYGGSMKPGNAAELLSLDGVDGGLIGGASLKAADFNAILDAVPAG